MIFGKLLVANRGEIATRFRRAAAGLAIPTVAIHPADDTTSPHPRMADEAYQLPGRGAAAYLDGRAIIAAATATGRDALHPGYGFLAENVDLAEMCAEGGQETADGGCVVIQARARRQ